jgi:hypothetical protein
MFPVDLIHCNMLIPSDFNLTPAISSQNKSINLFVQESNIPLFSLIKMILLNDGAFKDTLSIFRFSRIQDLLVQIETLDHSSIIVIPPESNQGELKAEINSMMGSGGVNHYLLTFSLQETLKSQTSIHQLSPVQLDRVPAKFDKLISDLQLIISTTICSYNLESETQNQQEQTEHQLISHLMEHIKMPLTTIKTLFDTLADNPELLDENGFQSILYEGKSSVNSLYNLFETLLFWINLNNKKLTPTIQPLNLWQTLVHCKKQSYEQCSNLIECQFDVMDNLILFADKKVIQSIFHHLITFMDGNFPQGLSNNWKVQYHDNQVWFNIIISAVHQDEKITMKITPENGKLYLLKFKSLLIKRLIELSNGSNFEISKNFQHISFSLPGSN